MLHDFLPLSLKPSMSKAKKGPSFHLESQYDVCTLHISACVLSIFQGRHILLNIVFITIISICGICG